MKRFSLALLLVLAAASALAAEVRAELKPLEFLVGSCWTGAFPGGNVTDTHCFESVYGGQFIRDRHAVRGGRPYQGETLYAWDAAKKKIVYTYWASSGGVSTGVVEPGAAGELVFPEEHSAGKQKRALRNVWTRQGDDAYEVLVWQIYARDPYPEKKELWRMKMTREPAIRSRTETVAGERVLVHEAVVPAPVEQVWRAFATSEGLRAWAAPVAEVEVRTGGKFHSNYNPDAKVGDPGSIYNTVLAYVPLRMFAFKIGLTEIFPAGPRQAGTLFAVAEFEPAGEKTTRVRLTMAGFGAGEEWDKVLAFFDRGNTYSLASLRQSFISGPVDWKARAAAGQKK